jgi:hypothetical protein
MEVSRQDDVIESRNVKETDDFVAVLVVGSGCKEPVKTGCNEKWQVAGE